MITKNTLLRAAALALVITSAACGNKADTNDKTAPASKSEEAGADMSDFREVKINNTYSMKLPDYMDSTKTLNDEASLQYQNIYKETYMVVIDESKKEFVDVYKELGTYDNAASTLKNYSKAQSSFFKENAQEIKTESKLMPVKINGLDAEMIEIEARVPDVALDIYYLIAYIEGKDKLYTVMAWTMPDRKEKYKADLEMAIKSFKEL